MDTVKTDNRNFNILSIDFDFFQRVTGEFMVNNYPDGAEVGTEESNSKWAARYAVSDILLDVRINRPMLNCVKKVVSRNARWNKDIPVMVTANHRYIYPFVQSVYDEEKNGNLTIYNIDMHHDMFNTERRERRTCGRIEIVYETDMDLHCGNWATYMVNRYRNVNIPWICHPVSNEVYETGCYPFLITQDIRIIEDKSYDAIFLCRSDEYIPPHLDPYFSELVEAITAKYTNVMASLTALKNREVVNMKRTKKELA